MLFEPQQQAHKVRKQQAVNKRTSRYCGKCKIYPPSRRCLELNQPLVQNLQHTDGKLELIPITYSRLPFASEDDSAPNCKSVITRSHQVTAKLLWGMVLLVLEAMASCTQRLMSRVSSSHTLNSSCVSNIPLFYFSRKQMYSPNGAWQVKRS